MSVILTPRRRRVLLGAVGLTVGAAGLGGLIAAQAQTAPASAPASASATTADPDAAWLGVVVSDVPEALRQHLALPAGQGLMVRNVVRGSPAEAALQRYDILLRLDGQAVSNTVAEFVAAVSDKRAGEPLFLQVLRSGKKTDVPLQLAERPRRADQLPLVYADADDARPAPGQDLRGHWLRRGPQGAWIAQDLPDLPPEVAQMLQELMAQQDAMLGGALPPGAPGQIRMRIGPGAAAHSSQAFNARIVRDGVTYTFRQSNAQIDVTTEGPGGKQTATYASVEQFRRADPATYAIYEQALGRVGQAPPAADPQAGAAPPAPGPGGVIKGTPVEPAPAPSATFSVSAAGEITVELSDNGQVLRKTYASEAELARQSPQLYEQYKQMAGKLK